MVPHRKVKLQKNFLGDALWLLYIRNEYGFVLGSQRFGQDSQIGLSAKYHNLQYTHDSSNVSALSDKPKKHCTLMMKWW